MKIFISYCNTIVKPWTQKLNFLQNKHLPCCSQVCKSMMGLADRQIFLGTSTLGYTLLGPGSKLRVGPRSATCIQQLLETSSYPGNLFVAMTEAPENSKQKCLMLFKAFTKIITLPISSTFYWPSKSYSPVEH